MLHWGYGLTLAATTLLGVVFLVLMTVTGAGALSGRSAPIAIFGCAGVIVGLAFLVFGVMTIFFYIRMRRYALRAARAGAAGWSAAAQ